MSTEDCGVLDMPPANDDAQLTALAVTATVLRDQITQVVRQMCLVLQKLVERERVKSGSSFSCTIWPA